MFLTSAKKLAQAKYKLTHVFHDYNFQKGKIDLEHGIQLKKCSLITLLQTLRLHFASPKTQTEKKYISTIKKYQLGFAGKIFGKFFY